jgi:hypothetical protein
MSWTICCVWPPALRMETISRLRDPRLKIPPERRAGQSSIRQWCAISDYFRTKQFSQSFADFQFPTVSRFRSFPPIFVQQGCHLLYILIISFLWMGESNSIMNLCLLLEYAIHCYILWKLTTCCYRSRSHNPSSLSPTSIPSKPGFKSPTKHRTPHDTSPD